MTKVSVAGAPATSPQSTVGSSSDVTRERDAAGRVVVEAGPAGRTTFERDAAGRVRSRTDGAGRTVRAIRDRAGRVESITGDEGTSIAFQLDLAGRPTRATTRDHALTFARDADGRQSAEVGPDARLTWTRGTRNERLATPWGELVRGTDEDGRVVSLASPAGTFRWAHDAQGRVARVTAPNGVTTTVERDPTGRESMRRTTRGDRTLLELATSRDATGRATVLRRDGAAIALSRDERGRLTRATGAGLDLDHAASDRGERLVRDGAGRLVGAGETRYGWDDLGRLVQVERRAPSGVETVRYGYDGLGRLATRTTSAGTTRYVHADGQLLAELGPGERTRVWLHGPGLDAPLAYGDGTDGEVAWTFLHGDATETALAYSDAAGARVAQAVVGPFGETVVRRRRSSLLLSTVSPRGLIGVSMGKALDDALARQQQRLARAKAEEELRSIPGVQFEGFDEDPSLPVGSRAHGIVNRLDAPFDTQLSKDALEQEREAWLLGQVEKAGVGEECLLYLQHGLPWARVRIAREAWTRMLAQQGELVVLGPGVNPKIIVVVDDWHERRWIASIVDSKSFQNARS